MKRILSIFILLVFSVFSESNSPKADQISGGDSRAEVHYKRGVRFAQKGDYDGAIKEFRRVIEIEPSHEAACERLGILLGVKGENMEAIKLLNQAVAIDPDRGSLHYNLGVAYTMIDDDIRAAKEYKKAISLGYNLVGAYVNLGRIYMYQGNYVEAENYLKKAISLNPKFADHFNLARAYLIQGKLGEAERQFRRLLAKNPNHALGHYYLGLLYEHQKRNAKALKEFRKAVESNPNKWTFRYRLSLALQREGKKEEAQKEMSIYAKLFKKYEDKLASDSRKYRKNNITTVMIDRYKSKDSTIIFHRIDTSRRKEVNHQPEGLQSPIFSDVTAAAGINFKHFHGAKDTTTILETMGSGVAFCDYNNDGYLDIYLVNSFSNSTLDGEPHANSSPALEQPPKSNVLYLNNHDGTFIDVTPLTGVGDTGYGMGCTWGDYDNDGDSDLYVTNYGKNVLYRNNGDNTFTDVTDIVGLGNRDFSTSCAFGDYDADGDLDLYVTNYVVYDNEKSIKFCVFGKIKSGCPAWQYEPEADVLYMNNGDGTFTDVTKDAGIAKCKGRGLGVAFCDYDNDGDIDIYVANDLNQNPLYRNNGDGTFTNVSLIAGVALSEDGTPDAGMGIDFGDYDNDGYADLLVTDFQSRPNILYRNEGGNSFRDISYASGVAEPSLRFLAFGAKFFDYNNDGFLDLIIANGHVFDNVELFRGSATYRQKNLLLRNDHKGRLINVSNNSGLGLKIEKVSRGLAVGDYDNDGDLDVLISNSNDRVDLLRNKGGNRNNWLTIKLIGVKSNREGLNTRIRVTSGPISQMRDANGGGSYLSYCDNRVFFGLGVYNKADRVKIKWPSGIVDILHNVEARQILIIREGSTHSTTDSGK